MELTPINTRNNIRELGRLVLTKISLWRSNLISIILLLTIVTTIILIYADQHKRTFLVTAETYGAEIAFDGSARSAWHLEQTVLCIRRPRQASTIASATQSSCQSALYDVAKVRSLPLVWEPGTVLLFTAGPGGGLEIDVRALPGGEPAVTGDYPLEITVGSRLLLTRNAFRASGGLVFSGTVTIGALSRAGARGLLRSGRYEVRETLPLRSTGIAVAAGTLYSGDSVTVFGTDGGAPVPQKAHGVISPGPAVDDAFNITSYSALGRTRLVVERFGTEPTTIVPSWADRAIRDPYVLGATAVLTLTAILFSLITGIAQNAKGSEAGDASKSSNGPAREGYDDSKRISDG